MLNQSRVLQYIKTNLAFPFQKIEYTDEMILDYVVKFSLKEFSYYIPDRETVGLNLANALNRVPGRSNEFYIVDNMNLEILNVANIYFDMGNLMFFGHPTFGAFSINDVAQFALNVEVAGMVKQFSSWDYTFEFKHPNIVRISPNPTSSNGWIAVEYERIHPPDFSKIPNEFQIIFCDFALADIMIQLGRIRAKYSEGGGIASPFGNIPISSGILDEGKEKKKDLIDKLTAGSIPNVVIVFG